MTTPEERACRLVTIESDTARDHHTLWLAGMMRLFTVYQGVPGKTALETAEIYREGFVRLLRDSICEAVMEEREACAVLAYAYDPSDPSDSRFAGAAEACRRICAAIRGRPQP